MLGFNIMHFILSLRPSRSGHSREAGERLLRKCTSQLRDGPALDWVASFSTFGSSPKKLSTLPFQPSTEFRKEKLFPGLGAIWLRTIPTAAQSGVIKRNSRKQNQDNKRGRKETQKRRVGQREGQKMGRRTVMTVFHLVRCILNVEGPKKKRILF